MKCLIFDSDGTLVDSELLNCQALATQLARLGVDCRAEALLERYRGWQLRAELDDLEQRHGVELDAAFVDRFRHRASGLFSDALQAVDGVRTALEQLNHPMCVASNGPLAKLQLALRVTRLEPFFAGKLFSAYEVGSFKPDPGLFLFAAKKMGYAPADCVVIEDSEVGLRAAAAADMNAIFYNPEKLSVDLPGRVAVIEDMTSLPGAVAGFA